MLQIPSTHSVKSCSGVTMTKVEWKYGWGQSEMALVITDVPRDTEDTQHLFIVFSLHWCCPFPWLRCWRPPLNGQWGLLLTYFSSHQGCRFISTESWPGDVQKVIESDSDSDAHYPLKWFRRKWKNEVKHSWEKPNKRLVSFQREIRKATRKNGKNVVPGLSCVAYWPLTLERQLRSRNFHDHIVMISVAYWDGSSERI